MISPSSPASSLRSGGFILNFSRTVGRASSLRSPMCVCVCVYAGGVAYMCMFICVYVYVYVYILGVEVHKTVFSLPSLLSPFLYPREGSSRLGGASLLGQATTHLLICLEVCSTALVFQSLLILLCTSEKVRASEYLRTLWRAPLVASLTALGAVASSPRRL